MSDEIVKVAWGLVRDGRVLCGRTRGLQLFYNIGGKPDPGETDEAALCREVLEEVGVELVRSSIRFVCELRGPGVDKAAGKTVVFRLFTAEGVGEPRPCGEVEELRWVGVDEGHLLPLLGQQALQMLLNKEAGQ